MDEAARGAGEFFKGLLPLSVLPMTSNFCSIYRKKKENQQPFPSRQTDTVVLFLELCVWKWNVNWGLRLIISESACQEVITFHENFSLLMWSPSTKHFSSSGLCCLVKVSGCDDRVIFLSCWRGVESDPYLGWATLMACDLRAGGLQLAPPFSFTYATGKLQPWRCRLLFCLVLLQIWAYVSTHPVYDDDALASFFKFFMKDFPCLNSLNFLTL